MLALRKFFIFMPLFFVGYVFAPAYSCENPPFSCSRIILSEVTGDQTYGHADIMTQILETEHEMLFGDFQGKYNKDDGWSAALGSGVRNIVNDRVILGAYIFFEQSYTENSNKFWDVSPGIELMTNHWDAHLNGYIPIGDQKIFEQSFFGDEVGQTDDVTFDGHTQFDSIYNQYEVVGDGADAEVGYTVSKLFFLNRVRFSLGGYYFRIEDGDNITGGIVGIHIPMKHNFTLHLNDSYDNENNNTFLVSVALQLGGPDKSEKMGIEDRILDPIPRNLATYTTSTAIPSQTTLVDTGEDAVERTNIWFFSTNGAVYDPALGENQGTFGDPIKGSSFTQDTVDSINNLESNANFYLSPGTYTIVNSAAPINQITLNNGQNIFGRTSDYYSAASDNNKPIFVGRLNLAGDNSLNNISVTGTGTSETTGIYANNADNITLNHVMVNDYHAGESSDATGIDIESSNNVYFESVTVKNIYGGDGANGASGSTGADDIGGTAGDGTAGSSGTDGGNATGIAILNSSNVKMTDTSISNINGGDAGSGGTGGDGGDASNSNNTGTSFTGGTGGNGGDGGNGGNGGEAVGLELINSNVRTETITISNLTAGIGGDGANGGSGGNADANNNTDTSNSGLNVFGGTGGSGGAAGSGGAGGTAKGITQNDGAVTIKNANVLNIFGGNGGSAGTGGSGGSANVNGNQEEGSGNLSGDAGIGGAGGSGGIGGAGGEVIGINMNQGSTTISDSNVSNLNAGNGGSGGNGGNGGDTTANQNEESGGGRVDLNSRNSSDSQIGIAGDGGIGGAGGAGGSASGIASMSSTNLDVNTLDISDVSGGAGATGGDGGVGGNADITENVDTNSGRFEANYNNGANASISQGGNGGLGGNGGGAGNAQGVSTSDTTLTINNLVINNINGGVGASGGAGGNGGTSNTNDNSENANGQNFINSNNSSGAAVANGGDGGNAGDSSSGGNAEGVIMSTTTGTISNANINNLNAGLGGSANASGGAGGSATANNNTEVNGGAFNINRNNNAASVVQTGGNGGIGGNGADGGDALGVDAQSSSNITLKNTTIDNLTAGNGGNGSDAGNGGDAVSNDNSAADAGAGNVQGGIGGDAGASVGSLGLSGTSAGVSMSGGSTVVEKNFSTQNIINGNNGVDGNGGAGGSGEASGNTGATEYQGTNGSDTP